MNTNLAQMLSRGDARIRYDSFSKDTLSRAAITAALLKEIRDDYSNLSLTEISSRFLDPKSMESIGKEVSLTDQRFRGLNVEDANPYLRDIRFDRLFKLRNKFGDSEALVNIELEGGYPIPYRRENRMMGYSFRLGASQRMTEFHGDSWDNQLDVWNIWIILGQKKDGFHHEVFPKFGKGIRQHLVAIEVSENIEDGKDTLDIHRLIKALFLPKIKYEDRFKTIESFEIEMTNDLKERTENMCNLAISLEYFAKQEGIAEGLAKGKAEGLAKGKAEGLAKGIAEGRAEYQNFQKKLLKKMQTEGREQDFLMAVADQEMMTDLMRQYGYILSD